jgi:drug/metabolite transporter (DMT)-like permease
VRFFAEGPRHNFRSFSDLFLRRAGARSWQRSGDAPENPVNLSPNLRGNVFMVIATACFALNDAITKFVSSEINFGQVMLIRSVFAMMLIASFALRNGAMRPLRTILRVPIALRVVCEVSGAVAFLAAITHLPLANTYSIFQALPLVVTLGAVLTFGEHVGWRRWLAIAAGFIGVLIIVRPGFAGFNQYSLLALCSVILCAVRDLATKRIPNEIPALFITLLTTISVGAGGALLLGPLGGWSTMSGRTLALLVVAGTLVPIGYNCIIIALRVGDISAVAPFRYTALIWAGVIGYLVFGEVPDAMMVTGASVIVGSGLYALYRERIRDEGRPAATSSSLPPDGL